MKSWSYFILLWILWSCGDNAQPAHGEYCLNAHGIEGSELRMAAYWSGTELAVDQPLTAPYCLSVPEPKDHNALRDIDSIKVLLPTGLSAATIPYLETYTPLLIVYEDKDRDQRFTPPSTNSVVIDPLLRLSYGEDEQGGLLSWVINYATVLQGLRDDHTQQLFATQPEPGVPFVYNREDFYYQEEFLVDKRAEPFKALPLLLDSVDPWCQVELKLLSCGPLIKGHVETLWEEDSPPQTWHASTLPESIRNEEYLDESYPSINHFAPNPMLRIWERGQDQSCWLIEGIAIAVQNKYYDADLNFCACETFRTAIRVAVPADDLPSWWPCDLEPDPTVNLEREREQARVIAEEIGLHLPEPSEGGG